MPNINVVLPSKPRVLSEKENSGIYEIEGLYPGYGYTLGNSLRRIILSSLPGAAITMVKIDGVQHEFSTMDGVKEDVVTMLLNIKKLRFRTGSDEPQIAHLKVSGPKEVTSKDIKLPGQVELVDGASHIATLTAKSSSLDMEITIERGIGYAPKESLHRDRIEIGSIALDAAFTAVRRVNYEVENMRVGERTDFNKLRMFIETDGTMTPREALEKSIEIMLNQLRAIIGFQEEKSSSFDDGFDSVGASDKGGDKDASKLKIEDLELTARSTNALVRAGIKTVGGLARKSKEDLLEVEGLGGKALDEIVDKLAELGFNLRNEN